MILVDTSVWIDHLRSGDKLLAQLLDSTQVLTHPFVIGELACGNLSNRKDVLALLTDLPGVVTAADEEVLFFIEQHQLIGCGVGYIDAHLLSSTFLAAQQRSGRGISGWRRLPSNWIKPISGDLWVGKSDGSNQGVVI